MLVSSSQFKLLPFMSSRKLNFFHGKLNYNFQTHATNEASVTPRRYLIVMFATKSQGNSRPPSLSLFFLWWKFPHFKLSLANIFCSSLVLCWVNQFPLKIFHQYQIEALNWGSFWLCAQRTTHFSARLMRKNFYSWRNFMVFSVPANNCKLIFF